MEVRPVQRRNHKTTIEALRIDVTGREGSIAEQIFRVLRSSIVTMRVTPATALSEQDVADRLNVSRQPVREAFIKLSEIGLVRVLPQWAMAPLPVHAVMSSRLQPARVKAFVAFLADRFGG